MPYALNRGLRIHYEIHGEGRPVILLHGGTVSFEHNYAAFGWIKQLNDSGFQVIGLDFRGHGKSDKPHDSESYGTENLAGDVTAVLDQLQLSSISLIAYSIGTAVALHLLQKSPKRFDKAVLMATGDGLIGHAPYTFAAILPALALVFERTEYPRDLPKHLATYWNFVAATNGDRAALLAMSKASYPPLLVEEASSIGTPVLVISGENDLVLGRGPRLADALGNGNYLEVAGADHFSLAADPSTRVSVVNYLTAATGIPAR
jgi:pimeloyl-ACP methyl ester carboxylesterase